MPSSQNDKYWKKAESRFGGETQKRTVNEKTEYLTWINKVKIIEKEGIINREKYFIKKFFDFEKKQFFVELRKDDDNTLIKFYKNAKELNKELNRAEIKLDTFIDSRKALEHRKKIISDMIKLKESNLLGSALEKLNKTADSNQEELLESFAIIFKYLTVLEDFNEKCLAKAAKESFFKKITIAPLLILTVISFKVIQKIATTLPMEEEEKDFADYQNAFFNLENFFMATMDILLNTFITAKLAKLAKNSFFAKKEDEKTKIQIKDFNLNDFLDVLIISLESLEEEIIYDNEKYLKEISTFEVFLVKLKAVENQNDENFTFDPILEEMTKELNTSEAINNLTIEKAKAKINKTITKFNEKTTLSQGISIWNSITNLFKELSTFALSSIAITGAAKNTLSLDKYYPLDQWLTKDILNWKDWVGNFVRYAFLYPSVLVFEKALKTLNISIEKPYAKLSEKLNSLPTCAKLSSAVLIFVASIAASNVIKTESSLIAADNDVSKSFESLLGVLEKAETWLFFALGTTTDTLNCYIKNTYKNWKNQKTTEKLKNHFDLELLKVFDKKNDALLTDIGAKVNVNINTRKQHNTITPIESTDVKPSTPMEPNSSEIFLQRRKLSTIFEEDPKLRDTLSIAIDIGTFQESLVGDEIIDNISAATQTSTPSISINIENSQEVLADDEIDDNTNVTNQKIDNTFHGSNNTINNTANNSVVNIKNEICLIQ